MFKNLFRILQEDIIGTDNKLMAGVWAVCITLLLGVGLYLGSESMSFLGVADSREQQVSFEYPVEIKRLHVISGQAVKKGDLLAELDQSELNGKIRLVRQQLAKLRAELRVREHLNSLVNNAGADAFGDPLTVDIADFEDELRYLEQQKKNLYIFSEVDGIVGAVNFRKGEKVPSFTSLVTLSSHHPSFVQGFVHENLQTKLEIGRHVTVHALTGHTLPIEGKIVSVGSRIVLMPPRLLNMPTAQIYGREVVVEIPPNNALLLGEKVQIKPKWTMLPFASAVASSASTAHAETGGLRTKADTPQVMNLPANIARRFSFEPSGMIYLNDLKKFLVISDDTDDDKSPALFLVDSEGRVDDQVLMVPRLPKVSDLESISQDGEYIYLMTSQGVTKKGKDKKDRNLLIRTKRSGLDLSGTQTVDFKPLLIAALKNAPNARIKKVFQAGKADIEIESHLVEGPRLYVGFKAPLGENGRPLVLQIENLDEIFSKKMLSEKDISLLDIDGFPEDTDHRLSDLIRFKGRFYAATVRDAEDGGAVWRLNYSGERLVPEKIQDFDGLKPEGLAVDPSDLSLVVIFDEKDEPAKFTRLPMQPVTPPAKNAK